MLTGGSPAEMQTRQACSANRRHCALKDHSGLTRRLAGQAPRPPMPTYGNVHVNMTVWCLSHCRTCRAPQSVYCDSPARRGCPREYRSTEQLRVKTCCAQVSKCCLIRCMPLTISHQRWLRGSLAARRRQPWHPSTSRMLGVSPLTEAKLGILKPEGTASRPAAIAPA